MWTVLSCWVLSCVTPDVVVLNDGTRLVGKVRAFERDAQPWLEVTGASEPLTVPASKVAHHETTAAIKRRFRSEARKSTGELREEATLALWALNHGLPDETFAHLDRAAALEGGLDAVGHLIQRAAHELTLDGRRPRAAWSRVDILALLKRAGDMKSPASGRVAHQWLVEHPNEDDKVRRAIAELTDSHRLSVRRAAVAALAERGEDVSLLVLIDRTLREDDDETRAIALEAVLSTKHPQLALPYASAVQSSKPEYVARALPALSAIKDPRAMSSLISLLAPPRQDSGGAVIPRSHIFVGEQVSYVQDFEVEIAQGATIADPQVGVLQLGAMLDVRVTASGPGVIRGDLRRNVIRSLRRISGRPFGDDFDAWRTWWAANRERVLIEYQTAQAKQMQ